jgi:hypothetical protein
MKLFLKSRIARGAADRERSVWYHGSSIANLRSILTQGLVPEVKKKNWDSDPDANINTPSRESYGGTYVTQNLMTALSAPKDHVKEGRELLVCMELQPRSFYLDEDDITHILNSVLPRNFSDSIYWILQYWLAASYDIPRWRETIKVAKDSYIKNCLSRFARGSWLHPKLEERLEAMLPKMWLVALARIAAHSSPSEYDYKCVYNEVVNEGSREGWDQIPPMNEVIPKISTAETEFKMRAEQLTRTLKIMARPEISRERFMPTGRLMWPIGFSGKNKITGIIEVRDGQKYLENTDRTVELIIHYGFIPDEFWEGWRQKYGNKTKITTVS